MGTIKYTLVINKLTEDPDDYRAVVQDQVTRTEEDIINEMLDRGSTVTKADILSVLEDYRATYVKFLRNGDNVKTPLAEIRTSILGTFVDKYDRFDRSRHEIKHRTTSGEALEGLADELTVEKVSAIPLEPRLEQLIDFRSGAESGTLTPGGSARLRGEHLKIDTEDAEQGIWLLGPDNGAETKVELIMNNLPSELMFEIPEGLASGEYSLEVRARPRSSPDLRINRLSETLVVS